MANSLARLAKYDGEMVKKRKKRRMATAATDTKTDRSAEVRGEVRRGHRGHCSKDSEHGAGAVGSPQEPGGPEDARSPRKV